MSDNAAYASQGQIRVLLTVEALALSTRTRGGLRVPELVDAGVGTRDQAFRALHSMQSAGWAEQAADGRWRLTARAAMASELTRAGLDILGGAS